MIALTKGKGKTSLRIAVGVVAVLLLLLPPFVMALVWTGLNFLVALFAVLLAGVFSRFARLRWLCAALAAALIAVPPYPYWIFWGEAQGWHFSFFHGFTWQTTPVGTFIAFFIFAMALFAALFWALPGPRLMPNNSFKPKPLRGSA